MKQVIALKLEPSVEQHQALLETLEAFNRACQYAADVAFENRCSNKIALQRLVYGPLRAEYRMSAQMAIRAIAKVCEAYRRDRRIHLKVDLHGAMVYDQRIFSFKGVTHVSLLTLEGRAIVPMRYGAYQAARLDRAHGQADLVYRDGTFYLYSTIDMPAPPPIDTDGAIGVDMGIVEIATDSEGNAYSGDAVRSLRVRMKRLRSSLQSRGTKSAKRHLKKAGRRQSRFVRHTNHVISKQIVQTAVALRKTIALEALEGIRQRASVLGREMRWLMGNWAFNQLGQFVAYKAAQAGIPVVFVDPRNTSRMCSSCGYTDKANRTSQAHFRCLQCGLEMNADLNAALNIKARAAINPAYCSSAIATALGENPPASAAGIG